MHGRCFRCSSGLSSGASVGDEQFNQAANSVLVMRVVVIGHGLWSGGGLTSTRRIIASLLDLAPGHEFSFIVPRGVGYEEICSDWQMRTIARMHALKRLHFDKHQLPRIIEGFGPDVVLAMDAIHAMEKPPSPQAVMVGEAHLFYPRHHFGPMTIRGRLRLSYLKWHFRRSLDQSDLLFVQTGVIAERIGQQFSFEGPIWICGSGTIGLSAASTQRGQIVPAELHQTPGVLRLFCPTRYYPHKNLESLVRTFSQYRKELHNVVVLLTIEPRQHPRAASLLKSIEQEHLQSQLVNVGPIPYETIDAYYAHCDALLLPTLLETAGLPYWEALGLGVPVITSDLDFAHEACGDAAMYFDPWSAESIRDAILEFRDNAGRREELQDATRERSRSARTWNDVAKVVIEGLESIADNAS